MAKKKPEKLVYSVGSLLHRSAPHLRWDTFLYFDLMYYVFLLCALIDLFITLKKMSSKQLDRIRRTVFNRTRLIFLFVV